MTVVELLLVHRFTPQQGNYWVYMAMNLFAPHQGYAQDEAVAKFREMVDAPHAAGIGVWLDVVYNHTAEGGWSGRSTAWPGSTTARTSSWARTARSATTPGAATPRRPPTGWSRR